MGTTDQRTWGLFVADAVRAQKMSIRDVAVRIGVSHNTLRAWLSGSQPPNPYTFEALSQLLKVPHASLLLKAGLTPDDLAVPAVQVHTAHVLNTSASTLSAVLDQIRGSIGGQPSTELVRQFLSEGDDWELTVRPAVRGWRFARRLHTYIGLRFIGTKDLTLDEQRRSIEDRLKRIGAGIPVEWRTQRPHDWPPEGRPPHILVVPDIESPRAALAPMAARSFKGSIAVLGPPWAHAEQVAALLALGLGWGYEDWRYGAGADNLDDQLRGFCRTSDPLVWSLAHPDAYQRVREALVLHQGLLIVIVPGADVVDHGAHIWGDSISRAQARWMAKDLVDLTSEHKGPAFGLSLPRDDSVDSTDAIERNAVADATMILACEAASCLTRMFGFPSTRVMNGWIGDISRLQGVSALCRHHPDHLIELPQKSPRKT